MKTSKPNSFNTILKPERKPDQKNLKTNWQTKKYKKYFRLPTKQLASNKVCHTLSSSQRTHTHQHHQPQQPANFSEPCSIFEFVTLSGATPQPTRTLFPAGKPGHPGRAGEPARPGSQPRCTNLCTPEPESGWSSRIQNPFPVPLTRTSSSARLPGALVRVALTRRKLRDGCALYKSAGQRRFPSVFTQVDAYGCPTLVTQHTPIGFRPASECVPATGHRRSGWPRSGGPVTPIGFCRRSAAEGRRR